MLQQKPAGTFRLQSAMEYLMTYGWAILIIAIALVALFSLGVFNSANFAPRAQPGACQVVRNAQSVSLQGQCQGELPEFVAVPVSSSSGGGMMTASATSATETQLTVVFWLKPVNNGYWGSSNNPWENLVSGNQGCWDQYFFYLESGYSNPGVSWSIKSSNGQFRAFSSSNVNIGSWQQFVGTYNGSYLRIYQNGVPVSSPVAANGFLTYNGITVSNNVPGNQNGCDSLSGSIANVQVYGTSLSENSIKALYQEGIGAAPIDINNLLGWWPLNGNTNDYSGNGNNGNVSGGMNFVGSWLNGYTQP